MSYLISLNAINRNMKSLLHWSAVVFLIFFYTFDASRGHPRNDEWKDEFLKNTAQRINDHGYPAEIHQIETEDNYVITMFRIPYSPKLKNQYEKKPAVLLQHGLLSSSDAWILNGPNDALAFLMSDAGYDVFLGNARGNRYSRNNTRLSTKHPYFWRFSWHEIGVYDISAMIDKILSLTGVSKLHYVGHSQGTTVFMVLMSMRPEYNEKIKTSHLLAPVAFMSNMSTVLAKYTKRFIGRPNRLTRLFDTMEVLPSTLFFVEIYENYCKHNPTLAFMCSNLYFLFNNIDGSNPNMNMTIAAHSNETHPAGASSSQVLHYMQEYESGRFCQFDYGEKKNMKIYGRPTSPDYDVNRITAEIHLYYSDNDDLVAVIDVEHLISLLPNVKNSYHVPDPIFQHSDFIWSLQVKDEINDRVIGACNTYEKGGP